MRTIFRHAVTGAWVVAAIVVGTIFRQNIEQLAAATGWSEILQRGWSSMSANGYAGWVLFFFGTLTGVTLTAWIDFALRRFTSEAVFAGIAFRLGQDWSSIEIERLKNVHSWRYTRQSTLELFIVYENPVEKAHISVLATANDVTWRECQLTERAAIVEIKGTLSDELLCVSFQADKVTSGRQQQAWVWQDAVQCTEAEMKEVYDEVVLEQSLREKLRDRFLYILNATR